MLSTQLSAIDKLLMASQNTLQSVEGLREEVSSLKGEVGSMGTRIQTIENHMTGDKRFQQNILAAAKKHVTQLLGGSESEAYKSEYKRTITWLWADYRQFFGVTTYADTKVVDYDRAMGWIADWRPLRLAESKE